MPKKHISNKKTFAIAVLIVLGIVLYGRTASYNFVWDDVPLYLNKTNYPEDGRMKNLAKFWKPGKMPMFAPVTYTVWSVLAALSTPDRQNKAGLSPTLFHLTNIIVHIANSILVFLILLYLFKHNLAALAAAMIFLLHPIQVESVAWVSELRGLLAGLFGFAALLTFVRQKVKISGSKYSLIVFLLILSFLSKPSGIVFPFIILAVDFFYIKSEKIRLRNNAIIMSFLTIIFFILSVSAETHASKIIKISLIDRLLLPLHSFVFYLYKTIIPFNLVAVYGKTPEYLINSNELYIYAGIFVILAIILYFYRHKLSKYGSALIIAFIGILPTAGLISFYYQTFSNVADRYFYISMFGIAIILTLIFSTIKTKQAKLIPGFLALLLFILSWQQVPSWASEYKHWDNIIKNSSIEIPQAYMGRGEELTQKGKYGRAIEDFTKAINLNPKEPLYYYNRANVYLDLKQYSMAIKDYDSALAKNDKLLDAYVNRGIAYSESDLQNEAISSFKKALIINPNQSDVYNYIAISYALLKQYDSTKIYLKKALAINPNDADAKENLKLLEESTNERKKQNE